MPMFILTKLPDKLHPWNFFDQEARRFKGMFPTTEEKDFDIAAYGDGQEHKAPWVLLPNITEEQAEQVANHFASKTPGSHWYISEVKSGTICPPSAPTKLVISDKGVLPA